MGSTYCGVLATMLNIADSLSFLPSSRDLGLLYESVSMIPVLKLSDEAVLEPLGAVLGRKNVQSLRLLRHTILFIKSLGSPWSRNVLLNIVVGHCGWACQRISLQRDC